MKKLMSFLLALTMLFCTACTGSDDKADSKTSNIYTDITGIAYDEIVMTVGEIEIPAELYFYWITNVARQAESYYFQYYIYTGQYGHILNEDLTLNWNASYVQGLSMGDVIYSQALEQLAFFVIVESMAASYGVALSDADRTEIVATIEANLDQYATNLIKDDAANESLTREEVEAKYFYTLGVSRASVERLLSVSYLTKKLTNLMMTEGSALYITEEAYNDMAFYADHILIATVDLSTGMALSSDKIAEKTALAEDILKRLQNAEDPSAVFGAMADMYSEDTGRASYPTGYIFTPGTMVTEFEDAVAELEPGQISGLVKSTYGYHIILRKDLMQGLEEYPDEKAALAETYLNTLVEAIMVNSTVSTTDAVSNIVLSEVYTAYMEKTGQSIAQATSDTPIVDK